MKIQAKFNIGDKVTVLRDPAKEVHEVLGFSFDESGFVYKVSAKEVDVVAKELLNGVSFYKEAELVIKKDK